MIIHIKSGWSKPGGSTVAFINLTNALNKFGYKTIFYGPHSWHLNKCKSEQYSKGHKLNLSNDDIVIVHFMNDFVDSPPIRGFYLSCHEQDIFPIKEIKYQVFNKIHYISEHQKNFHNINHPYFILPNILDNLKPNKKPKEKIGGIIGSIDENKQTHISIIKALEDGCNKVYIYNNIINYDYWKQKVEPLVDGNIVILKRFEENKQKMYDSITDVYHNSINEVWSYVKGECKLTETNFHGNSSTDGYWEMSKEEIVKCWIKELGL